MLIAAYAWIKALHVIAVIAWMAALLYLPRLFVYHADAPVGSERSEIFKVMERRLYLGIFVPAMLATLILGIAMLVTGAIDLPHAAWLHAKLALVVLLLVFSHFAARWRRAFAEDRNHHTARFFRAVNEVPTVLMIGIVILAIVKPF